MYQKYLRLFVVWAAVLALAWGGGLPVCGQIVNTEAKRFSDQKPGLSGTFSFGGAFTHNVVDILSLNLNARLQHLNQKKNRVWLFLSDFSLLQSNGDPLGQRGYQHVRFSHDTHTRFMPEAFAQIMFNPIQKLKLRTLSGAGARIKLVENDSLRLRFHAGCLYMFEHEELLVDNTINNVHRLSAYLTLSWQATQMVNVTHTTYFQPNLIRWVDYRLSTETNIRFDLTKRVNFSFYFNLFYDNDPPPGLQHAFYQITNGLGVSF